MRIKTRGRIWTLLAALAVCVSGAWAQQRDPRVSQPLAPYPPLALGESSSKSQAERAPREENQPVNPDTRPLSGAELFTLKSLARGRNSLWPSFQFAQALDTNNRSIAGRSEIETPATLSGRVAFERVRSRYHLIAEYEGGGTLFVNTDSGLNSSFHQLGVTETISWRRWVLQLNDRFSYLPDSSFGSGDIGTLGSLGAGLSGGSFSNLGNLNPIFVPSQSILTGRAPRVSNTLVGEVRYSLSQRSSITASGSFGLLRFLDAGFINSNHGMFRTGYNRALSSRDTLSIIYGLNIFRFDGSDQALNSHVVQMAYGRRITGRLALQVSAGPQINAFRDPVAGSNTQLSWSMGSNLQYRFPKTELDLDFLRYVNGGSGVLVGALANQVGVTARRPLSRMWTGAVSVGYSHNQGLQEFSASQNQSTFQSWHGGVNLTRPLGRYTNLFFSYDVERQASSSPLCGGSTCGTVLLRHYLRLGFNWQFRPIAID